MKAVSLAAALLALAAAPRIFAQQLPETVDLAGEWRFAMDRGDVGKNEGWFNKDLADRIKLPGSLQFQGFGDDISTATPWVAALPRSDAGDPGAPYVLKRWWLLPEYKAYTEPGNIKVPYLSQPVKHYLGVAWYQRDLDIPARWNGKVEHLFLERPRWGITVYVDDKEIGTARSLVAPDEFEMGALATGKHRLSIRADNRMSVFPGPPGANNPPGYRPDGHSVSDALGQTWNGIVGRIEMRATPPVWIDDAQVYPTLEKGTATVKIHVLNSTGKPGKGMVTLNNEQRQGDTRSTHDTSVQVSWDEKGGEGEIELSMPDAKPWDEFHPLMQQMSIRLDAPDLNIHDMREINYGMREVSHDGKQLLLNGHEINLRMTHSGGDFPLTGYPATDVAAWKKIIQTCKDYGLNGIRFHSWCPPEACFTAADELGFYIQPECGMWNNFSNPGMLQQLETETALMQRAYGNHPSYLLLSPSNEPAGNYMNPLGQWAARWYKADPRRLYAEDTGRDQPNIAGPTYAIDVIRGTGGWFGRDYAAQTARWNIPVLGHEVGQWCSYPDFDLIKKFTGYLKPGNYEIYRDSAIAKGVLDRNKEFTYASGKFQVECYKQEIEANLRTAGLSGFQLLDLHDYIGQGGALVGVLDPFWESKGYVTPEEWRHFCGPVVVLARVTNYIERSSDSFNVPIEIANFGEGEIKAAAPAWKIVDLAGKTVASGQLDARDIPIGKSKLGTIAANLGSLPAPGEYRLVVWINELGVKNIPNQNSWNFWLYPSEVSTDVPADILVSNVWRDAAAKLAAGGKVLYTPGPQDLGLDSPPMKNVPIFWNRLMVPSAAGDAMLGLWVDNKHPALAGFPTEGFCDWQWIEIVNNVKSVNINNAPKDLRPIVSAIDDWSRNDKLAVLFECNVGSGRLLVSAINMVNAGVPQRATSVTVGAQLKRSLLDYMASDQFKPKTNLTPQQVQALWVGPRGRNSPALSTAPGFNPGDVIESPNTLPAQP